jgi:hypothetical protein
LGYVAATVVGGFGAVLAATNITRRVKLVA